MMRRRKKKKGSRKGSSREQLGKANKNIARHDAKYPRTDSHEIFRSDRSLMQPQPILILPKPPHDSGTHQAGVETETYAEQLTDH